MKYLLILSLLIFSACGTDKIKGKSDKSNATQNYTVVCDTVTTVTITCDTTWIIDTIPTDTIPTDTVVETQFGLMQSVDDKAVVKKTMQTAGINLIRLPLYFERTTKGNVIDDFLNAGFNVAINFNWKNTSTPITFPKDTNFIRQQAKAFFQYYQKWLPQIPFVVCENEWDNDHYRDWKNTTIQDYITELKIVIDEGHKYGFKIAAAGITGNSLGRWTYSQLTGSAATSWNSKYYVGSSNANYQPMLKLVNEFARLIRDVDIDYLNTHWYNNNGRCSGGYAQAYDFWAKATGKEHLPRINNEFGFRLDGIELCKCTIKEMRDAKVVYAIAYSGSTNTPAQRWTPEMLKELK